MNARLNSDDEQEENAEGTDGTSAAEKAVPRPQLILHKERPERIIFIEKSGAVASQARQLP